MRHTLVLVPGLVAWLSLFAAAGELRLDSRTMWEQSLTENIALSSEDGAIELARGVLHEDDGPAAGYCYHPNEETLSDSVWICKDLSVERPAARRATLLVGGRGEFDIRLNDRSLPLAPPQRLGNYWLAWDLPPESLVTGRNRFVLSGSGRVWIAGDEDYAAGSRTIVRHPNRSARSTDGGRTWNDRRLGPDGSLDGEYYVRLFLDQHVPEGTLTLPVLDTCNLEARLVAPCQDRPGPIRIIVDAETPAGSRVAITVRSGAGYVPDESWSEWQETNGTVDELRGRYVQMRLRLASDDPLTTPRVHSLQIHSDAATADDWTQRLKVIDSHNEEIVRTSIPFEYEPFDHPKLKLLREKHLDRVAEGAESEFELVCRLARWSASQWRKGHLGESYPPWDALEILSPHADGTRVGGFCQQYNIVFLQACESFGLVGRAVSLGPHNFLDRIRSGHEVVEIWSGEHRKWIYVDGQFAWYAIDKDAGTPLSLLELHERQTALFHDRPHRAVEMVHLTDDGPRWEGLASKPPFLELRLIPRSNFLEETSPLPLNQGMRGWFWTGHYAWAGGALPARELYSKRVTNPRNWQWTLNQAHYYLEATMAPGEMRVHLDTETPGFETFVAEIDGGEPRPVEPIFAWRLHAGKNRLRVLPRNAAGRNGIASRVAIEYEARLVPGG
ncbi:MAG: hypothetical protein KY476_24980 [Planctomycetes bacterium]|nr:hypothetical protein [Planctomycetota bacterium]